jgi:hypothetical protein
MKKILLLLLFAGSTVSCFAQKQLLSYDDLRFLLQNNLQQIDTFMMAKGYKIPGKNNKTKNRNYTATFTGGTYSNIDVRLDGKRLFIEIETNELDQYDLIRNSISQYLDKNSQVADVQTYTVKELGSIYITVSDTVPYDPLRKDYDMHIVSDKHITAYN